MSDSLTNTDDIKLTCEDQVHLLDELISVLTGQLQLARRGNSTSAQFGALSTRAGSLVKEIQRTGILTAKESQTKQVELRKLYEKLCLIVAAHKVSTHNELNQICKGRKTIVTYRSNIRS